MPHIIPPDGCCKEDEVEIKNDITITQKEPKFKLKENVFYFLEDNIKREAWLFGPMMVSEIRQNENEICYKLTSLVEAELEILEESNIYHISELTVLSQYIESKFKEWCE